MKDHEIAKLVNSITKSLKEHPHLNLQHIQWLRSVVSEAVKTGLNELETHNPDLYLLDLLHRVSYHNRLSIERSKQCGCFYCERIYDVKEINKWTDKTWTAVCPFCGCDTVIGDFDYQIDKEILKKMHIKWIKETTTFGELNDFEK